VRNKGREDHQIRKLMRFELGDWVWVHMRKERFPEQRRSKLMPQKDGPFQIVEMINDNAYKLDLPYEYGVSATFNVTDLSLFDVGDNSRSNSFKERRDDVIPTLKDSLQVLVGLVTRLRVKRFKKAFKSHHQNPLEVPVGPVTRLISKRFKEAFN